MNDLYLKSINKNIAKQMIIKNHYSHTIAFGISIALGVFKKTNKSNTFFDVDEDELLGCIVYSVPVGAQVYKGISDSIISQTQIMELTRLWIDDSLGKNTESWVIAQSFQYLKNNHPDVKVLISYSDLEQGHTGKIYQATNWLYQGKMFHKDRLYSFDGGLSWKHNKGLRNTYKCSTHEDLLKVLPKPVWFKYTSPKFRYIYILANKKEKREILATLKYQPQPYPKTIDNIDTTITKYE